MNARQLTVNVPADGDAVLILPLQTTPELLARFERSLADPIGTRPHELRGEAAGLGEIEYQSWMQHPHRETADAGETEYASWLNYPQRGALL